MCLFVKVLFFKKSSGRNVQLDEVQAEQQTQQHKDINDVIEKLDIRVITTQRETTQIQDTIPQVDEAPKDPHTDVVNPLTEVSPAVGPLWRSNRLRR